MSPDVSTRQKWRDHIDRVADPRKASRRNQELTTEQFDRLVVSRTKLVTAICNYLQCLERSAQASSLTKVQKRAVSSSLRRTRASLVNDWKCDEQWLKALAALTVDGKPPTKDELNRMLDFPPRGAPQHIRLNRKHTHAA